MSREKPEKKLLRRRRIAEIKARTSFARNLLQLQQQHLYARSNRATTKVMERWRVDSGKSETEEKKNTVRPQSAFQHRVKNKSNKKK